MKRTVFSALAVCLVLLASSASFSDVIISEVADPNDDFNGRFVELYNTGITDVDLSAGWALLRFANGNIEAATYSLTSTINSCSALTIANNASNFQSIYGFAPDEVSGFVSGNGDDVYALWDGTQIVDIYGVIGIDGTGEVWEYEDGQAIRNANVDVASAVFDASEWQIFSDASGSQTKDTTDMTPGTHVNNTCSVDDPDASLPAGLGFGPIGSGATQDQQVVVTNSSLSTLALNIDAAGFVFSGTDPSVFSVVGFSGASVPVGGTTAITIRYTPGAVSQANHNAVATLSSDDPNNPSMNLTGSTALDVADVAAARANSSTSSPIALQITGAITCTVVDLEGDDGNSRNEYFEDASGNAIRFDGNTTTYNPGDQLSNVVGLCEIDDYAQQTFLVIDVSGQDPGAATPGTAPTPLLVTGANLASLVDGTFVRLNDVVITAEGGTPDDLFNTAGPDGNEENLTAEAADSTSFTLRVEDQSPLRGTAGATPGANTLDVIGIKSSFNGSAQLLATAIENLSDVQGWTQY